MMCHNLNRLARRAPCESMVAAGDFSKDAKRHTMARIVPAILFSLCFALSSASVNAADTPAQSKPDDQPELKVINLAVYPAPIPRPAMKYHLLPRYADQTPGNAALLYDTVLMQIAWEQGIRDEQSRGLKDEKELEKFFTNADKLSLWLETPLAEIPKNDVRKLLDNVQPWWMDYIELASRQTECDWGLQIKGMHNPLDINIYYEHLARSLARIIAMKARLSLAEGKPEEALKSLQMGFALSQHLGQGKVPLVCYAGGSSTAGMMRDQLLDLSQLKNAPNLYWSLSNLPHPFLSFRDTVEFEESLIERLLPQMQEAKKGQHTPEQWQKLWEDAGEKINDFPATYIDRTDHLHNDNKNEIYDPKKILTENYPKARDYLINIGWPEKEIQSMAPARVMLLHCAEIWGEMFDDYIKWLGINYSQWPNNYRNYLPLEKELKKIYKQKEIIPLSKLIPPFGAVVVRQARFEREMESLRCIEAIRLYAYSHNSKLPGSLGAIKEVPIPPNPMTGKPFSYHLEGDTAVLLADGDGRINYEYRIKIAK